jgi:hypothetical protein
LKIGAGDPTPNFAALAKQQAAAQKKQLQQTASTAKTKAVAARQNAVV